MTIEQNTPIEVGVMELPATYINRFQVSLYSSGLVRVAFGEIVGGEGQAPHYRAAVIMTLDDAGQLSEALRQSLDAAKSGFVAPPDGKK